MNKLAEVDETKKWGTSSRRRPAGGRGGDGIDETIKVVSRGSKQDRNQRVSLGVETPWS